MEGADRRQAVLDGGLPSSVGATTVSVMCTSASRALKRPIASATWQAGTAQCVVDSDLQVAGEPPCKPPAGAELLEGGKKL